jgi:hypothetical protein
MNLHWAQTSFHGHRGEGKSEDAGELDFSGLLKKR